MLLRGLAMDGNASPEQKRDWRLQLLAKGPLRIKGRPDQDPAQ